MEILCVCCSWFNARKRANASQLCLCFKDRASNVRGDTGSTGLTAAGTGWHGPDGVITFLAVFPLAATLALQLCLFRGDNCMFHSRPRLSRAVFGADS